MERFQGPLTLLVQMTILSEDFDFRQMIQFINTSNICTRSLYGKLHLLFLAYLHEVRDAENFSKHPDYTYTNKVNKDSTAVTRQVFLYFILICFQDCIKFYQSKISIRFHYEYIGVFFYCGYNNSLLFKRKVNTPVLYHVEHYWLFEFICTRMRTMSNH